LIATAERTLLDLSNVPKAEVSLLARVSPDEAASAVEDVLGSIGDTCPECPPEE
jgi:hypothetical protein